LRRRQLAVVDGEILCLHTRLEIEGEPVDSIFKHMFIKRRPTSGIRSAIAMTVRIADPSPGRHSIWM